MSTPKALPRVDYPSTTDPEARAAYAAGLRHLADLIDADPDCPYPHGPLALFVHDDDNQAEICDRLRRGLGGGKWDKQETASGTYLTLEGMCAGVPINIWLDRNSVCERVVVGTKEIVDTVPVGEDTRPVETVTRTEDIVEWRCHPLLAAADETPAAVQS